MTLTDFRVLKGGDAVIHSVLEKDRKGKFKAVRRAIQTPICSDQVREIAADEALSGDEIVCDVHFGDAYRDDLVVAGEQVDSIRYFFFHEKLATIRVKFPSLAFHSIVEAFDEKYGRHDSTKVIPFQNEFGATWLGKEVLWRRGQFTIVVGERDAERPGSAKYGMTGGYAVFSDATNQPAPNKPPVDF